MKERVTMRIYRSSKFQAAAAAAVLWFGVMLLFRTGVLHLGMFHPSGAAGIGQFSGVSDGETRVPGETWMKITQNGRTIGHTHRQFVPASGGYRIDENMVMVLNTMGLVQKVMVVSSSRTNRNFALKSFTFSMVSGSFQFSITGKVRNSTLFIKGSPGTRKGQGGDSLEITLDHPVYLTTGILPATLSSGLGSGSEMTLYLFDPATMGQVPATVSVKGWESIAVDGRMVDARHVQLSFKGTLMSAWVDGENQVIREEGLLGITLEKTTQEKALGPMAATGQAELTSFVSVPSNVILPVPSTLERLQVRVSGVDVEKSLPGLATGSRFRQTFQDGLLTIRKESPEGIPPEDTGPMDVADQFLKPGPFIQSDDERIRRVALRLVSPQRSALENVRHIVAWIQDNIKRRPVISLPNALSTLEQRAGDCNEHAALMGALCRAGGIPAGIDAGLVYLEGRFYYHAWNRVFVGRWITVDALFNQIPADVTHIAFTRGTSASQLDLMGAMGRITLEVVAYD